MQSCVTRKAHCSESYRLVRLHFIVNKETAWQARQATVEFFDRQSKEAKPWLAELPHVADVFMEETISEPKKEDVKAKVNAQQVTGGTWQTRPSRPGVPNVLETSSPKKHQVQETSKCGGTSVAN